MMVAEQASVVKRGRGRPKLFEREEVIDKALLLFWKYGYEATVMSDLIEVTGAKAPTLYAEFGNKEGIFWAVAERYVEQYLTKCYETLLSDKGSVRETLRHFLLSQVALFTDVSTPAGCFIVTAASVLTPSSTEIRGRLIQIRQEQEQGLIDYLMSHMDTNNRDTENQALFLSRYLLCFIQGLSAQAREGRTQEELESMVEIYLDNAIFDNM